MSKQHGSIERLDAKYKGLRLDVDLMFDAEGTLADVQAMLLERYKVNVPISTIGSYKTRVYAPEVEQLRDERVKAKALKEQLADGGLDDIAEATIAEQLAEARRAGERASLTVLLREQRERSRIQIELRNARTAEKNAETAHIEAEARAKAAEGKLEGVKGAMNGAKSNEQVSPEEVLRQIDDILNIRTPAQSGAVAALPGALGQG